jgi:hypothetical protein
MKGNFKPAISMNGRFRRIALKNGWTTAELISNHEAMAQSMMGERQVQQDALFYEFSLERHVLEKHFAAIDRFVEFDEIRAHSAPLYSETGLNGNHLSVLEAAGLVHSEKDSRQVS